MPEMKWFERKFSFDLPVWMFPNIVERIRGTPARADDIVKGLTSDVLTKQEKGNWSIQENIGHLADLEPLWMGRVEDLMSKKERLRDADLTNRKTHEANHNASTIQEILSSFRKLRLEFVETLDELDKNDIERSALHPRLNKPMRLLDLIFFVAEHDDHHLAQITRLKRHMGK